MIPYDDTQWYPYGATIDRYESYDPFLFDTMYHYDDIGICIGAPIAIWKVQI